MIAPRTLPLRRRLGSSDSRHRTARAFTLVELLTVIAIIAIMSAIIFPVFHVVQENTKRASCMSNMHQIAVAVKQFQLDNRSYPDFLFGEASGTNSTMETATTTYQPGASSGVNGPAYTRLYPEYVKSLDVFHCPDNDADSTKDPDTTGAVSRLEMPAGGTASQTVTHNFYKYDSYDANPDIDMSTGEAKSSYVARYSKVWTPVPAPSGTPDPAYNKQLVWRSPSDDTYITMCSYHTGSGKITMLWLNGTTKTLDIAKLKNVKPYQLGPND